MYVWIRLPRILAASKVAPRADALTEIRTPLRVLPGDIDAYQHLNNGRYLTLCDIGRYDWSARTGAWKVFRQRRWFPVIATAAVTYRRSLELFQRFELSTKLIYWDDKWFYIEHGFIREGSLCAKVLVKGVVRDEAKHAVSMSQIVEALGEGNRARLPIPDIVRDWSAWEKHMIRTK